MHPSPLLAPVVALVAWTLIVMLWMMARRFPLLRGRTLPEGARGSDLESKYPGSAHWPAHNYQHLMEQPTIFYAIVLALVLMGFDSWINVWLAWGYVGLRIVHSIIQATINVVKFRFLTFLLASICLVCLTIHAVIYLIHHG